MDINQEIAAALHDRKLSKVSGATGISQPTLARLRDNRGPFRASTLAKIAEYLGIELGVDP